VNLEPISNRLPQLLPDLRLPMRVMATMTLQRPDEAEEIPMPAARR